MPPDAHKDQWSLGTNHNNALAARHSSPYGILHGRREEAWKSQISRYTPVQSNFTFESFARPHFLNMAGSLRTRYIQVGWIW